MRPAHRIDTHACNGRATHLARDRGPQARLLSTGGDTPFHSVGQQSSGRSPSPALYTIPNGNPAIGSRPLASVVLLVPGVFIRLRSRQHENSTVTLPVPLSGPVLLRAASTAAAAVLIAAAGCARPGDATLTRSERAAIADSIQRLVTTTYDLSAENPVARLMSLYPESGAVYSANSGRITSTRADLQRQVETFWRFVGSNMRNPEWEWTAMQVAALSPNAAVMSATYQIRHLTPQNTPHAIGGAWTALFERRNGRWLITHEHLSDAPPAPGN